MFRLSRLACLVLTLFFATMPARAEDLGALIAGLGGASFADKEKAIVALGKSGDPRAVPILQALGGDQDSEVRTAMQRSLSASHLFAGSKEERLAAIRALGTATDPQVKNLLDEFRYTANIDPGLYKAAGEALVSIDSRLRRTGI